MGYAGFDRGALVRAWMLARLGRPRIQVLMMWQHTQPGWPADATSETFLVDDAYGFVTYRCLGPGGVLGRMESFYSAQGLQQAWCAFCDQHLSALGFDVGTLKFRQPPVSGKSGGGFPLTAGFP